LAFWTGTYLCKEALVDGARESQAQEAREGVHYRLGLIEEVMEAWGGRRGRQ
jgi:hypothetical protein